MVLLDDSTPVSMADFPEPAHLNGQELRPWWAWQWPYRYRFNLACLASTPYWARRLIRNRLLAWERYELIEATELLVSELVTNAVKAMQTHDFGLASGIVQLGLFADETAVLVEVWDAVPIPPQPTSANVDDEGGRGLLLVASLSTRWGWYYTNSRRETAARDAGQREQAANPHGASRLPAEHNRHKLGGKVVWGQVGIG